MRICFVNGSLMQFTVHELLTVFRHPLVVGALLSMMIGIVVVDPFADVASLPVELRLTHWVLVLFGAFGTYLATLILLGRSFRTGYSILAHLMTALVAMVLGPAVGAMMGLAWASVGEMAIIFGFSLSLSVLWELVMITYLLPRAMSDLDRADAMPDLAPGFAADTPELPERPAPAAHQQVVLLGRSFDLRDLRLVSAEEHYVQIHTATGRHMLRGRISDIEAQLPDAWGRRVHRSHWVATANVRKLHRHRMGWTLELLDGTQIPVARARRDAVRDWVSRLGLR